MRILLCQSYLGANGDQPQVFPLGLAYLTSMLKKEHDLFCWDPNIVENPMDQLSTILEDFNPNVVGVSLRNIDSAFSFSKNSYYPPFVSMIKTIKEKVPSCKLVVGGAGFSLFAKEIMERNHEIDYGIVTEGEYSFPELLKSFDHPEKARNLVVRANDKVFFSGRQPWINFDLLPTPSRDFFDIKKYKERPYSIGIQSSRGCSYRCIFCPNPFLYGTACRLRSPKKVVDEIEEIVNDFDINSFYFVDASFNAPFNHGREICREIVRRKLDIDWAACYRPDLLNAEFMEEAIRAGCNLFDFSPDGACNASLQFLRKDFTTEHVDKTITLASKIENANVSYNFVYDLPKNNHEHVLGLLRLVPRIIKHCGSKLRFISFTKMRIYPHTLLSQIALEQGKINGNTNLIKTVHYESSSSMSAENLLPLLLSKSSILFETILKSTYTNQIGS